MLFSSGYADLLAAGRATSADGHGWEIARVIPSAALKGQAAGTAGHPAIQAGCPLQALDADLFADDAFRESSPYPGGDG